MAEGRKANGQFKKGHTAAVAKPRKKRKNPAPAATPNPRRRRVAKRRHNPGGETPVVLMNPGHVQRAPRRRAKRRKNPENPAPVKKRRKKRRKNPEMGTFARVALGLGGAVAGAAVGTIGSQALEAKSTWSPQMNSTVEVIGGVLLGAGASFLSVPFGLALGLSMAAPALARVAGAVVGVGPGLGAPAASAPPPAVGPAPKAPVAFQHVAVSPGMLVDVGGLHRDELAEARAASTPLRRRSY